MSYHVSVTCTKEACDLDERFEITGPLLDPILANIGITLRDWDEKQGLPLVGNIQAGLSRLVGVLPPIEGMDPADQASLTYVTIGVLVLVRDAIIAHKMASTVVSVTS